MHHIFMHETCVFQHLIHQNNNIFMIWDGYRIRDTPDRTPLLPAAIEKTTPSQATAADAAADAASGGTDCLAHAGASMTANNKAKQYDLENDIHISEMTVFRCSQRAQVQSWAWYSFQRLLHAFYFTNHLT